MTYLAEYVAASIREPIFNVCYRRVAGIRFLKIGRLTFTFSVARDYRSL